MSFLICSLTITAQQLTTQVYNTDSSPTLILKPKSFHVSQPVRDMPVCDDLSTFDGFIVPKDGHNTSATMSDKRTRKLNHLKSAGKSSTQTDPLLSTSYQALHETQTRAPLTSFERKDFSGFTISILNSSLIMRQLLSPFFLLFL